MKLIKEYRGETSYIVIMITLILMFAFQVLMFNEAYDFSCPSQSHWKFRAKSKCIHPRNYSCLYDVNYQINVYRDKCIRPRIVGPGYTYVFQPNPNRGSCTLSRYQPFIFNTIGYSHCAYLKTLCSSEGQTTYTNDTSRADRKCACNTKKRYKFVGNQKNGNFCNPSIDDCSCYIELIPNNNMIGLKDEMYHGEINIDISRSHGDALYKSMALKNNNFDYYKYNLAGPSNENRVKAGICVLVLYLSYLTVAVGILVLEVFIRRCLQKQIRQAKHFVVAIDLGTTYSGYAFSERNTPNNIYTSCRQNSTFPSTKAPTTVLIDRNGEFVAFGFEAEAKYLESLKNDDFKFHYFSRFKMLLYRKTVNLDMEIEDQNGFKMKAFDIFSIAIKYLKDEAFEKLVKTTCIENGGEIDIHYVLTVPAIWNDQAKIFMRNAAEKAGIKSKSLTIALEPETVSIYCQKFRNDRDNNTNNFSLWKKPRNVVVVLGGGTADIAVHERTINGPLEEVLAPSGGAWGGTAIDQAYIEFLYSVFTEKVIKKLKSDELEDYTSMCHEFELTKQSITSDLKTDIVITLPYSLVEITVKYCKSVQSAITQSSYKKSVSFSTPLKLFVNPEVFRNFFKPTIDALISHLDKLLSDPNLSDQCQIIMVGGFSECELVQTEIRKTFSDKEIIIPDEAGLAVLRGAVLFGHQPGIIGKRILRKTYGTQSWPTWDAMLHPDANKIQIDGVDRCRDVFYKFAVKGEKVEVNHSVSQIFQALIPDEKCLDCTVYISDDTDPKYVTDPSCQCLGRVIIPIPPLKQGETIEIKETLIFGGTELLFRARNMKTGEIYETQFELN